MWDKDHPYRFRTWVRAYLPYFLIDWGVACKGEDCEKVARTHSWYNIDNKSSGCYHCEIVREGKLWENSSKSEDSE